MKTSSKAVVRRSLWSAVLAWLSSGSPGVQRGMRGDVFVGFGFRASQGMARPFVAFGKSFGAAAEEVDTPETLGAAVARGLSRRGPSLIEYRLPPVG